MITMKAGCLATAALLLGVASPGSAQQPRPIEPRPPAAPGGALGAITVQPPAFLSRAELARRLSAVDKSLPSVLPPGAGVIMTPARLQNGRTHLGIYGAQLVALDRRGAAFAAYTEPHEAGTEGFYLEFDAVAGAHYGINGLLAGNQSPALGGRFDIAVWGPGVSSVATIEPGADGHLIYAFATLRAGRYTINIERRPQGTGRWFFHRVELMRMELRR